MKTLVSWSSGKDSAWMVHTLRQRGDGIGALLTTINEPAQRVAMHTVRVAVLKAQAEALGFPYLWLDVQKAGLSAGLVDHKVAAFSGRLTSIRLGRRSEGFSA